MVNHEVCMRGIILIFCIIAGLFIAGCISGTGSTHAPEGSPMGTEKTFAADNGTGVNYSAVPIFSPSPIKTNASYVARIALEDNRVRELLRHGGRINATAGMINPGCPPTMAQPCYLPALIITYGPVTFAFEVDEQTGTVSHAYPYLADYPNQYVSNNTPNYYRVRSDDTISIYNGTTLVLAYNSTTFIYPEDWFKEELQ